MKSMTVPIRGLAIILLGFSTVANAAPQTVLSRKVAMIPDRATKASVITALGPPTHAYVGADLKKKLIDDPNVAYVLLWENPPCSAVEVWFGHNGRMNGMDGGQFCGEKLAMLGQEAAKPNKKYACATAARRATCSK